MISRHNQNSREIMSKTKFITQWFYSPIGKYNDVQTTGWFWNKKLQS